MLRRKVTELVDVLFHSRRPTCALFDGDVPERSTCGQSDVDTFSGLVSGGERAPFSTPSFKDDIRGLMQSVVTRQERCVSSDLMALQRLQHRIDKKSLGNTANARPR